MKNVKPFGLVTVTNLHSKPVYFPYGDYANNYRRIRGKNKLLLMNSCLCAFQLETGIVLGGTNMLLTG